MKTASELARKEPCVQVFATTDKCDGDVELARKLLELRHSYHLTHRQVAAQTRISYPYLSKLERAHAMPSVDKLARLAAFYETTLDALCGHMVDRFTNEVEGEA